MRVVLAAVAVFSTHAYAQSFQIVKTFDTPLIGTASFQFTIEKRILGVWVEIPCVDNVGSCTYEFSNLAAGTSLVLAGDVSWLTNGEYAIRELPPPGWMLDAVTATGTDSLMFDGSQSRVQFAFDLSEPETGQLNLHNVGPDADPTPAPTLSLSGLLLAVASLAAVARAAVSRQRRSG